MLNLAALKEVYVALGGDPKDFTATTNAEGIHLISTVASSGGGSGSSSSGSGSSSAGAAAGTTTPARSLTVSNGFAL